MYGGDRRKLLEPEWLDGRTYLVEANTDLRYEGKNARLRGRGDVRR